MTPTRTPKRRGPICSNAVEKCARARIETHPLFLARGRLFEFHCEDDVLVVRGCVPTYYLKQMLQSALKDLEGVRWIDNQVTVDPSGDVFSPQRVGTFIEK